MVGLFYYCVSLYRFLATTRNRIYIDGHCWSLPLHIKLMVLDPRDWGGWFFNLQLARWTKLVVSPTLPSHTHSTSCPSDTNMWYTHCPTVDFDSVFDYYCSSVGPLMHDWFVRWCSTYVECSVKDGGNLFHDMPNTNLLLVRIILLIPLSHNECACSSWSFYASSGPVVLKYLMIVYMSVVSIWMCAYLPA